MLIPRKIRFFGLRKEFNRAVETIKLLLFTQLKLITEIETLQKRVTILEGNQENTAMQEMFDDGWDAAMEWLEDETIEEVLDEGWDEADDEVEEEFNASERTKD